MCNFIPQDSIQNNLTCFFIFSDVLHTSGPDMTIVNPLIRILLHV